MSSIKIIELTDENTCNICKNGISKYACPKCNILYCSLECYQSEAHLACSENFYKDSVLEELKCSDQQDSEAKMKVILEQFHAQNELKDSQHSSDESYVEPYDSDDDIDDVYKSLQERLAGVSLDNSEDVWGNLNNDEKEEFEAFLLSSDISKFIPMWTPWWEYKCDKRIIDLEELEEHKCKCPKIHENIKDFSEISSKPPATCVQYNMMNVLAAYVFVMRYFNGDHLDFPKESSSYIYYLSLNVKMNQNFESFNTAINSITAETSKPELCIMTDEENLGHVKPDVQMILSGPHATERKYYLFCALSQMHNIFDKAIHSENSEENGEFFKKFTEYQVTPLKEVVSSDLKKALKKIEYFLSYARDSYEI